MNKNINTDTNDTILVPKSEMVKILLGTVRLARMHLRLIDLHEEESRLKKHHKAYLHIREYADQIYEDERLVLVPSKTMSEMLDDMCDLGMAVDDLLDIFYTLMDGGDISSDDLMERLIYAEDASEEAYARWGDSVRCMSE